VPLVKIATWVMAGKTLDEVGFTEEPRVPGVFVKAPVFPFRRFPGVDPVLGPEMKSTGEVMGSSTSFGNAFAKAWMGAGHALPLEGTAFLSVHDRDKPALLPVARCLTDLGFELVATAGTAGFLTTNGLSVRTVQKVHEGRPHVVDHLINGEIALVVNTPLGQASHEDDGEIRRTALKYDVPCITTLSGAMAAAEGIAALRRDGLSVRSLQEMHASLRG
jgi:carbamoyl-phosphate synthase large subunit